MQPIKKLVFDIETAGEKLESFDALSHKLLEERFRRYAETEEEYEKAKNQLAFSPLTSTIVAIGMLDADSEKGAVYFVAKDGSRIAEEEHGVKFESGSEEEMLKKFWQQVVPHYDEFITFGGRIFDAPVLMVRSAIYGIRPAKNLMPNRYLENQPYNFKHIDLQDQLTFYSAKIERLGLHFWCRAFGIPSPKEGGIAGEDVTKLFHEGNSMAIARYCMRDVRATLELYRKWDKYLRFA